MFVNVYYVRRNGERARKPIAQIQCDSLDEAEFAYRELVFLNPWRYPEHSTLEFENVETDDISMLFASI
jgi:hypothetical protein